MNCPLCRVFDFMCYASIVLVLYGTADHIVYAYLHMFFLRVWLFFLSTVLARGRVLCLPSVLIIVFSFCCVWLVCLRLCLAFMFLACACACLARVFCLCVFPCVWCLLSSHVFCI